jgi:pimeloyl-ACP methyl ester carboxylesterase
MRDQDVLQTRDILNLYTFNLPGRWSVTRDGALLALAIGKPLSQTLTQTSASGGQPEERCILWADLTAQVPKLVPLEPPRAGIVSFSPSWSPSGHALAFIRAQHLTQDGQFGVKMGQWRAFLSLWQRESGEITDLGPVCLDPSGHFAPNFHWVNDSLLLGLHRPAHERRLSGPWRETEADLGARYHHVDTAEIFDAQSHPRRAGPETVLSLFEIANPLTPVWQVHCAMADVSVGPPRTGCIVRNGDGGTASLSWHPYTRTAAARKIDTDGWTPALDKMAWDAHRSTAWALWERTDGDGKGLAVLDPWAGMTRRIGRKRYKYATAPHVCANGSVLFRAVEADLAERWYIYVPESPDAVALEGTDALGPEPMLEFADHIFVGFPGPAMTLSAATLAPMVPCQSGAPSRFDTAQIVWPHPQAQKQAARRTDLCIVRTGHGPASWHMTANGFDFTTLDLPDAAQVKALSEAGDVAILLEDATGTHIDVHHGAIVRRIASFNEEVARKSKSKTVFLSVSRVGPQDAAPLSRLSELLLPSTPPPPNGYPLIAHVYPHRVYSAHNRVFAHTSFYPHAHNPYIAVAQGYATLMVGMPIGRNVIEQGAEAVLDLAAENLTFALETAGAEGVNCDRVVLMGHSWGAGLALNLAARKDRYLGVIASAGLYNPLGYYGTFEAREQLSLHGPLEDASSRMAMQDCFALAPPWESTDAFTKTAALLTASRLKTPILLLHGSRDFVPVAQAEQMFTALLQNKGRARLVKFAGEGHIISGASNILRFHDEILMFLEEISGSKG